MNQSEKGLLQLLANREEKFADLQALNSHENAELFVTSALLVTVMGFLKEQLWLARKSDPGLRGEGHYERFITPLFKDELKSISFLKEFLIDSGPAKLKEVRITAAGIERDVLAFIGDESLVVQKSFAQQSLKLMKVHFLKEEADQAGREQSRGHKGLRLYRTFDNLDAIFDLDYQLDRKMEVDHQTTERLYQGAGVGVQSGYSTILLAHHQIDIDPRTERDCKVVDLGSGYGRVGLVCSLLSPEMQFVGYEYVPHRVQVANKASELLALNDQLEFLTQDLSLKSFDIPEADVYYLYDPFSEETYQYVLKQMVEVSKKRTIVVITKGNANRWLAQIASDNDWPEPIFIDEGNLCIFKSS